MKTIAVMGRVGSGKTRTAIKKAVSLGLNEVLYVTDEINKFEFAIILSSLFGDDIDFSSGDAIIFECVRIQYMGHHQPIPMRMYDVVVIDVHGKDIESFFYKIIRDTLIVTKQLNIYDEIIMVGTSR